MSDPLYAVVIIMLFSMSAALGLTAVIRVIRELVTQGRRRLAGVLFLLSALNGVNIFTFFSSMGPILSGLIKGAGSVIVPVAVILATLLVNTAALTVSMLRSPRLSRASADKTGHIGPEGSAGSRFVRAGLSPREAVIAGMLADGLTYPEAADRLGITLATVKTHIGRIYRKLGITGRQELARWNPEGPPEQTGDPQGEQGLST